MFKNVGGRTKNLVSTIVIGLCIFGATAPAISETQETIIKVAFEGIFPPFNYLDSNNKLQGFDVEIAEALCSVAKLKCEFVVQDWDGMIPNLLENKYDTIISSMSMSAERKEKVKFTDLL